MDSGSETEEPGIPKALVDGLQEAEAVLGALAGIFYPSDSGRAPNLSAVSGTPLPELEVRLQDPSGTDSGRGVYGSIGSWTKFGLCQPPYRGCPGIYPGTMAKRSGALVLSNSSG